MRMTENGATTVSAMVSRPVVEGRMMLMIRTTLAIACVLCLGLVVPLGAADNTLVRFDGGIGVIPVSNINLNPDGTVASVVKNIVRGVNPPGQIWVIKALKANVDTMGHIRVRGRGLLLGGGNNIGLTAGLSVFATLICSPAAPFTQFSTPATGVKLEPNGNFLIDDTLSPTPPSTCASPVLLIRNAPSGAWFAAGIVKLGED
jgi:hypothetical protein